MAYSYSRQDVGSNSDRTHWRPARKSSYDHSSPLERFFEKKDLPMYKDKPRSYLQSGRQQPWWRRKPALFALVLCLFLLWYYHGAWQAPLMPIKNIPVQVDLDAMLEEASADANWDLRRNVVREVFKQSWDAYEKHAWGMDEFHPIAKKGRNLTPKGTGRIIVDTLDTLMIMNLTSRLVHAREWVSTSLDHSHDEPVGTFNATARMLGGLLSAHYLSTSQPSLAALRDDDEGQAGEDLYIEKAADLANRLLGAFSTKSGIPYPRIKLSTHDGVIPTGEGDDSAVGATATGDLGGTQLEFRYLSKLIGETLYWETSERTASAMDAAGAPAGLVPSSIDPETGVFRGDHITLGRQTTAYYTSLVGQYLQSNREEPLYREMWDEALASARKHLITYSELLHLTLFAERWQGLSSPLQPYVDGSTCKMAGAILLAATEGLTVEKARKANRWGPRQEGELHLARELAKTCRVMYQITGKKLPPQRVRIQTDDPPLSERDGPLTSERVEEDNFDLIWRQEVVVQEAPNTLKGDTVEAMFYMFRLTNDVIYREWGWEMFCAYVNFARYKKGKESTFAAVRNDDNEPPEHLDMLDPAWFSQTLKFFYLLFSPTDLLPLNEVVFNAGGHALPVFPLQKGLKTGWQRKLKDDADTAEGKTGSAEDVAAS